MMFLSSLLVGIDLLIVIMGGGFGMGSGIFQVMFLLRGESVYLMERL